MLPLSLGHGRSDCDWYGNHLIKLELAQHTLACVGIVAGEGHAKEGCDKRCRKEG